MVRTKDSETGMRKTFFIESMGTYVQSGLNLLVQGTAQIPMYQTNNLFLKILQNIRDSLAYNFKKPIKNSIGIVYSTFTLLFFPFKKYEMTIIEVSGKTNFFDFKNMVNTILIYKRWLAYLLEFLLKSYYTKQFKKIDIICVSTPDLLAYAKRLKPDSIWLPMLIEIIEAKHKKNDLLTIFIPTRFARIKGIEQVFPLLDIVDKYKTRYQVVVINWGPDKELIKEIESKYKNVKVIPFISDRKKYIELLSRADIVFGQFGKETCACGRIELEAMAARVPVICCDHFETTLLKKYEDGLGKLLIKLLTEDKFKKEFTKSNYDDTIKNHSDDAVKALIFSKVEEAQKKKGIISTG